MKKNYNIIRPATTATTGGAAVGHNKYVHITAKVKSNLCKSSSPPELIMAKVEVEPKLETNLP